MRALPLRGLSAGPGSPESPLSLPALGGSPGSRAMLGRWAVCRSQAWETILPGIRLWDWNRLFPLEVEDGKHLAK